MTPPPNLRTLSDAATAGPWFWREDETAGIKMRTLAPGVLVLDNMPGSGGPWGDEIDRANAAYIVALINAHRASLQGELREAIARLVDPSGWSDMMPVQPHEGEPSDEKRATWKRRAALMTAESLTLADSILALLPAPYVPEGWVLVPETPTPDMIGAWYRQKNTGTQEPGTTGEHRHDYAAYRAMIAARPQEHMADSLRPPLEGGEGPK